MMGLRPHNEIITLSVLIDKSLVLIFGGTIQMHDLIHNMDKYIVEKQNDDLGEYIRLWDAKDFKEVMVNNRVNRLNNAIIFNLWFSYTKICLSYAIKEPRQWKQFGYDEFKITF
ncbi:hypothetical protein H5410_027951 [Solanum commersonii]|uniref:Disease resistance protein Roq1-like winged-helix domain-containing protein n=1 Tax=Solanum commersonii TaxID=4109 RepID=A0A9J5Z0K5_SOLCO|nr:hypothetical protein H5410_027951 [Solanum commersonii]